MTHISTIGRKQYETLVGVEVDDWHAHLCLCKVAQQFQHVYAGLHICMSHMHAMRCIRYHRYLSELTELILLSVESQLPQGIKHIIFNEIRKECLPAAW